MHEIVLGEINKEDPYTDSQEMPSRYEERDDIGLKIDGSWLN